MRLRSRTAEVVFAHDQRGVQDRLVPDAQGQRVLRRHLHGEPDPADLDHDDRAGDGEHGAAHGGDHAPSLGQRPTTPHARCGLGRYGVAR